VKKPRVVLAEDHSIVAEGLRAVLEPEVDVVGTVEDGRALLKAVAEHEPDIVITDLTMPHLNGIEAARQIVKDHPKVKVIILTAHADVKFAEAAFRAGVRGYVVKRSGSAELLAAIKEVQTGNAYLTPAVTKDVLEFFVSRVPSSNRAETLTGRQREVLQLIAEGATIKGIANALNISPKTAETHRYAIMKELDLHTTAELTRFAIQHGLISLE
jgi:DNA-binding NarL/FixJ family response regulator